MTFRSEYSDGEVDNDAFEASLDRVFGVIAEEAVMPGDSSAKVDACFLTLLWAIRWNGAALRRLHARPVLWEPLFERDARIRSLERLIVTQSPSRLRLYWATARFWPMLVSQVGLTVWGCTGQRLFRRRNVAGRDW